MLLRYSTVTGVKTSDLTNYHPTPTHPTPPHPTQGSTADLYHIMIYMFLSPGNVDCSVNGVPTCPENVILGDAPFQAFVQVVLVLTCLVCVPWMLFIKPRVLNRRHLASLRAGGADGEGPSSGGGGGGHRHHPSAGAGDGDALLPDGAPSSSAPEHAHGGAAAAAAAAGGRSIAPAAAAAAGGGHGHGHGEFDYGEVIVHQMIHTIEFVLGAISNTASYLRLWALSLAHAQLSAVFYDKIFMAGVASRSPLGLTVAFFIWASATMGVLMIMETCVRGGVG